MNALLVLDVGVESVSRESLGAGKTGEHTWNITFAASAGNVGQLQVYYSALDQDFNDDRPSGHVSISTLINGNVLLGNFTLNFNGSSTSPMPVDVTAIDMELQLKRFIKNVEVSRSSPTFQNGHEWLVTFLDPLGNVPSITAVDKFLKGTSSNGYLSIATINDGYAPIYSHGERLRFVGRLDALNAALGTAIYTPEPDSYGKESIAISINDNGHSSDDSDSLVSSININMLIAAVNDAPRLSYPTRVQNVDEDTAMSFPFLAVDDSDIGNDTIKLTISTVGGHLSILPNSKVRINNNDYTKQRATTHVEIRQNITEMQMIQCNLTAGNFTVSFYNAEFLVSYDLTATDLQSKFHDVGFGKISANSVGTSDDICGGSITLITFGNMGDVPLIQITDSNFGFIINCSRRSCRQSK